MDYFIVSNVDSPVFIGPTGNLNQIPRFWWIVKLKQQKIFFLKD